MSSSTRLHPAIAIIPLACFCRADRQPGRRGRSTNCATPTAPHPPRRHRGPCRPPRSRRRPAWATRPRRLAHPRLRQRHPSGRALRLPARRGRDQRGRQGLQPGVGADRRDRPGRSPTGRFGGSALDEDGVARPAIIGVALDGGHDTQEVVDTDGGQYDRDTRHDRAVGPMQFIPSTWAVVGVDGDDDGTRDPQDVDDAALATAVYLCSGNDDLSQEEGQRAAVYRYNHSNDYVDLVLQVMQAYLDGDVSAVPAPSLIGGLLPDVQDQAPARAAAARVTVAGTGPPAGRTATTVAGTAGGRTGSRALPAPARPRPPHQPRARRPPRRRHRPATRLPPRPPPRRRPPSPRPTVPVPTIARPTTAQPQGLHRPPDDLRPSPPTSSRPLPTGHRRTDSGAPPRVQTCARADLSPLDARRSVRPPSTAVEVAVRSPPAPSPPTRSPAGSGPATTGGARADVRPSTLYRASSVNGAQSPGADSRPADPPSPARPGQARRPPAQADLWPLDARNTVRPASTAVDESSGAEEAGGLGGPVGEDHVGAGAADGGEGLQDGGLAVDPAVRAAASTMEYSPEMLYAATGTSTASRTRRITSR